jgi:RNA polymerase sigma-70 factor (ECF subfamily)
VDEIPETRDSLLIRVADARDQAAWEQFARIYWPVVYNVARMRGLQDADAQDVAQQVLLSVSKALPTWERRDESTRFRHWLCHMARNATINMLTLQPRDRAVGGPALPADIPESRTNSDLDSELVREYRRHSRFPHTSSVTNSPASSKSISDCLKGRRCLMMANWLGLFF